MRRRLSICPSWRRACDASSPCSPPRWSPGTAFLDSVTTHLIAAGGKRLRPLLALAAATGGERDATQDDLLGARGGRARAPGLAVPRRRARRGHHPAQRRERKQPFRKSGRHRGRRLPAGPLGRHRGQPGHRDRRACWPTRWPGSARGRSPRCARPSRSPAATRTTSRRSPARRPRCMSTSCRIGALTGGLPRPRWTP